ncbi:MAG TPA: LysM peptidoglycan-binding domain-containing protein, partial [Candidatus Saccharimonadales bacterium]|nr:LysM peptidoglycan-binding domain-containing protein [Candidatus Saccharimonadales bacterium]
SLKPQLVGSDGVRSITVHTVKAGDTVDSVAAKYGISAQTLKWANDLTSDSLVEGSKLQIPPIDGVIYTVKSGDTIASIAERYNVDKERLVLFNDLDLSGLKTGSKITLPSATLPNTERPGYVAPVQQPTYYYAGTGAGFGGNTWHIKVGTPMLSGNTYAYGNCTAYAYDRRVQMGMSAYARMGNAAEWAVNWPNQGAISRTPSVGAIMQSGGGFGHVAIVEKLLPNGDIQISEMNAYVSGGGFNIVSGRTVLAGNVGSYLYIR